MKKYTYGLHDRSGKKTAIMKVQAGTSLEADTIAEDAFLGRKYDKSKVEIKPVQPRKRRS